MKRLPDPAGLNAWVNAMLAGVYGATLAYWFSDSSEGHSAKATRRVEVIATKAGGKPQILSWKE